MIRTSLKSEPLRPAERTYTKRKRAGKEQVSWSPDEIRVGITLVFFLCYTVAMRDFLCKVYDKLYCFLGYADMRLIPGYESGGKGCARISFYIRGLRPLFPCRHS